MNRGRVPTRKRPNLKSLTDVDGGDSEVALYEAAGGEIRLEVRLGPRHRLADASADGGFVRAGAFGGDETPS